VSGALLQLTPRLVAHPVRPENHASAWRDNPLSDQTTLSAIGVVAVAPIRIVPAIAWSDAETERTNANARTPTVSTDVHLCGCRSSRSQCG